MTKKRMWWAAFLAVLAVVGALALPACSTGGGEGADAEADVAVNADAEADAEADAGTDAEADAGTDAEADPGSTKSAPVARTNAATEKISEDGTYTSKDEVALYLHEYGHLPSNYVTKDEAEDAGWKTAGLDVDEACPGKSIGGDRFGNREKRLPSAKGRTWYECDIDYHGGRSRGAKRILYSSDGLIYYTADHYKTFERLY